MIGAEIYASEEHRSGRLVWSDGWKGYGFPVPGRIRDLLVQQVTATVRCRESTVAMAEMGVDSFIELGSGKVLTGLIKRIVPDAAGMAAGTPAEIEAMLKAL